MSEKVSPEELSSRAQTEPPDGDGRGLLRCLVTNDDGIGSEGLRRLALVAAEAGLRVTVAAPTDDVSGASASITAVEEEGRFMVERRRLAGLEDADAYAVRGLPAFIALTGSRGAFGDEPDIVLSGINAGSNTGYAILHSGTVGAALTASTNGCRAMAVSLAPTTGDDWNDVDWHWSTAADLACTLLPWLAEAPAGTVLNLNVPNLPGGEVRGLRHATLARFGAVQTNVVERGEGYVRTEVSEIDAEYQPGTDAFLLRQGYATLTALRPVSEATDVDLPVPVPTP
ncbi:MAG: 5'/3'-nucleotidase SurE [Acidimicrobiia bacterium]